MLIALLFAENEIGFDEWWLFYRNYGMRRDKMSFRVFFRYASYYRFVILRRWHFKRRRWRGRGLKY
jgi:hypothetical protein